MTSYTKKQLIAFETKVAKLFEDKQIHVPIHLSGGTEDELLSIFMGIRSTDYIFSTHRNHYHYLLHTGDEEGLINEIQGNSNGVCGGHAGSMHIINHSRHFYSSAIVAGCVAMACGVALGIKMNDGPEKVWCFVGDAATDEGWFDEAVRYAQYNKLPVTYIIEDNNRSVCSTKQDRWNHAPMFGNVSNVIAYRYTPTYPHVGIGKDVTF